MATELGIRLHHILCEVAEAAALVERLDMLPRIRQVRDLLRNTPQSDEHPATNIAQRFRQSIAERKHTMTVQEAREILTPMIEPDGNVCTIGKNCVQLPWKVFLALRTLAMESLNPDDNEPITVEWWRDHVADNGWSIDFDDNWSLYRTDPHTAVLCFADEDGSTEFPHEFTTRGQVRRLIKALKVEQ